MAGAAVWFHSHGYTLYFGDATAHLNIARRIFDSITPGYEQIGTVWLPLPHLLTIPFAAVDEWWRSGWAGAVPAAIANTLAALFLFLSVRRIFSAAVPAFLALALFLGNPNALYLGTAPMTEPFFFATFFATLYSIVHSRGTGSHWTAGAAGLAAGAGALVRYEGWFLLPFFALALLTANPAKRWRQTITFCATAALGPLYWLGHNRFLYADALEFYHGPYSAKAIYQRALDAGMARYPGDRDAPAAFRYFQAAATSVCGAPLVLLAAAGTAVCIWRRAWAPLLLCAALPAFYVLSLYSSGTPIFVPHLWPNSYYNTRYGLAAFPLFCLAAAAIPAAVPKRWTGGIAAAVLALAVSPWIVGAAPESWICWKESQVNSDARRAWTAEAAEYMKQNWDGRPVLASFGDLTGIFEQAGIPIAANIHEGNGPYFLSVLARPDLFLRAEWAITISGDAVDKAIWRAQARGPHYRCVKTIAGKGAPVVQIWRRGSQVRLPQEEPPAVKERSSFRDQ